MTDAEHGVLKQEFAALKQSFLEDGIPYGVFQYFCDKVVERPPAKLKHPLRMPKPIVFEAVEAMALFQEFLDEEQARENKRV